MLAHPKLAFFRWFADHPALYRIDRGNPRTCVWFEDLRFAIPGRDSNIFRYGLCREDDWRAFRLLDDGTRERWIDRPVPVLGQVCQRSSRLRWHQTFRRAGTSSNFKIRFRPVLNRWREKVPGCKTLEHGSATCPPEGSVTHKSGRPAVDKLCCISYP